MDKFEYSLSDGEPLTLHNAVFQALGAASACWDKDGVFLSERAKEIGERLIADIPALV